MKQAFHGVATLISCILLFCILVEFSCQQADATVADDNFAKSFRLAVDALDSNKYWIAEPSLKQCVSDAELFGFDDMRLAKSLSELGRYYTIRGRFQTAQPYLEREFAVKEVAFGKDDGRMVPAMGNLIKFYMNYGTASKADPLTDDLLAFVEGKMADEHFQNLKKISLSAGQPLQGFAGTAPLALRDPLLEWSIICDSIATLYRAKAKYEYSERLYKDALDIKATILGKGHLSLANSYDNLGGMCMEKGDLKEAEGYYRDALSTTENTLPPESPEVYGRLDKLAKCLIKEGKFSEAEELYLRALEFWKKEASKTGDESRCLYALGALYIAQKRYAAAASPLSRALRMCEKFSGPCSMALVPYLEMYAYDLYYLGRRGETAALRGRAAAITGPKEKPKVADDEKTDAKDAKDDKGAATKKTVSRRQRHSSKTQRSRRRRR